jgi:RimJ/RimL family protein N-acetyltransferase
MPTVPMELRTSRLLLRSWHPDDAVGLHPVLATNWEHLGPWIPARVATPVPVPELAERLAGFAADFAADREWRYGLFSADDGKVLGEVGLFPRDAGGRVQYNDADRVELGYWLRSDMTGRGLVTEGAQAVLAMAAVLPHVSRVEIRCDERNTPSAAVPQRLGFVLATTITEPTKSPSSSAVRLQVWSAEYRSSATG